MQSHFLSFFFFLTQIMTVVAVSFFFNFSRQGFSVVLEPVLQLALVDQAGLKLTEICLPLPPECWDSRRAPPLPGFSLIFNHHLEQPQIGAEFFNFKNTF